MPPLNKTYVYNETMLQKFFLCRKLNKIIDYILHLNYNLLLK